MWQAALVAAARPPRETRSPSSTDRFLEDSQLLLTPVSKIPRGKPAPGTGKTPRAPEAAPGHPSQCAQTGLDSRENLKNRPESGANPHSAPARWREGQARIIWRLAEPGLRLPAGGWPFAHAAGRPGCSHNPSASAAGTPPLSSASGDPQQPSGFPW